MEYIDYGYLGLFLISFLSATILPLSSEGVLLLMPTAGFDPLVSLIVASLGNILGGSTNYWIGRLGNPLWLKRIGIQEKSLLRFENAVKRFGVFSALLSWVPIIGDPLTVALGFFRVKWWSVLILMSLGKVIRYAIILSPWFF